MSAGYQAISWNRQKRIYDQVLALGVLLYLATFAGLSLALRPQATIETVLIRAFGTAALLLLHLVLAIGPLCRIDRRFLPLLYNRRHLGVTTFSSGWRTAGRWSSSTLGRPESVRERAGLNTRFARIAQFHSESC
jgi:hypothetical protein